MRLIEPIIDLSNLRESLRLNQEIEQETLHVEKVQRERSQLKQDLEQLKHPGNHSGRFD